MAKKKGTAEARLVKRGGRVRLAKEPTEIRGGPDREEAARRVERLGEELGRLADLLYYAGDTGLLLVLQGMDTSGKDGAIRHLLGYLNAQSTRVTPFKVPTSTELAHDFLWRVHAAVPGRGSIGIFNRSHYEDVAVVRVHELVPEAVWRRRYDHIKAFEKLLVDSSVIVLKFFLHISKKEQEERLLEREQDPIKSWKLSVGDWKERELWEDYQAAWEEALVRTSTPQTPWYLVPSDKKWMRDLLLTERVVEALRPRERAWRARLKAVGVAARKELEAYRSGRS